MSAIRKTTQYVLPVVKTEQPGNYDPYPVHDLGVDKIFSGYESLAQSIKGYRNVVIDGYGGVRFDDFARELNKELIKSGVHALWWRTSAAMKSPEDIDKLIEPYLGGDDPLFGFRAQLGLAGFFDIDKLRSIRPDEKAELNILIGEGASLAGWDATVVYIDIPKNEIQFRARSGSITNLGAVHPDAPKKMYKRFYFIDWVVLNKHKKQLLPDIDIYVDGQRENEITWAHGETIRKGLSRLGRNGFRGGRKRIL